MASERYDQISGPALCGILIVVAIGFTVPVAQFNAEWIPGIWAQLQVNRYRATTGTVLNAEVAKVPGGLSYGYRVSIECQYTVDAHTFIGTRYQSYDVSTPSRSRAERIVGEHRPGSTVTVYYDPGNPERSVLTKDTDFGWYYFLIFFVCFNGITIGLWVGAGVTGWRWYRGDYRNGKRAS